MKLELAYVIGTVILGVLIAQCIIEIVRIIFTGEEEDKDREENKE